MTLIMTNRWNGKDGNVQAAHGFVGWTNRIPIRLGELHALQSAASVAEAEGDKQVALVRTSCKTGRYALSPEAMLAVTTPSTPQG